MQYIFKGQKTKRFVTRYHLIIGLVLIGTLFFSGCFQETSRQIPQPPNINETPGPAIIPQPNQSTNYSSLDLTQLELAEFDLINSYRTDTGLRPLRWNDEIANVARLHSQEMALNDYFGHTDLSGGTHSTRLNEAGVFYWNLSGENLALVPIELRRWFRNGVLTKIDYKTADQLIKDAGEGWMNSTGHRHNILTPEYDESGMGIAVSPDGISYYFTQVFIMRATCGYETGSCCTKPGYYPYCFIPLRCVNSICKSTG